MNKVRFWFYSIFKSERRIFLEFYSKHPRRELLKINDEIRCEILAFKKLKNGNYIHCVRLYTRGGLFQAIINYK